MPDWLDVPDVADIDSVSNCVCKDFADDIRYWNTTALGSSLVRGDPNYPRENSIPLEGTSLFYYKAYEMEFDGESRCPWNPEPSFPTNVGRPSAKKLEGFDVNFTAGSSPECAGLCCSSLANELHTNAHCLCSSFEEAETMVNNGAFNESEPGPYRNFAVDSVDWNSEVA